MLLSAAAVHAESEGAAKRLCELLLLRNQDVVRRGLVPEDHDPLNDERLIACIPPKSQVRHHQVVMHKKLQLLGFTIMKFEVFAHCHGNTTANF